ncbi:MAG: hypothetical protein WKF84_01560 [Pyrinomonadaceae bacterium]
MKTKDSGFNKSSSRLDFHPSSFLSCWQEKDVITWKKLIKAAMNRELSVTEAAMPQLIEPA